MLLMAYRRRKYYDIVNGKKYFISGSFHKEDSRDIQTVGLFGLFEDYEPKHDDLTLPNLGIKDQGPLNTCGWVSTTTNRENTEKVLLAEQGLIQFAFREGFITGNGFSQLRDNCKVAQKFGIPEARFLPNDPYIDWKEYSRFSMSPEAVENALSHRCQSYAQVDGKKAFLKFLDEKNFLHTGMPWYHEYNMRGGFSGPWIIDRPGNTLVGGHAFEVAGYVKNYKNLGLHVRLQNSYTEGWGDRGYFYMPIDFALKFLYSRWIMLDIPVETARFLQDFNGRYVRATNSKAVYWIIDGKKQAFPDWLTFLAYGGLKSEIVPVDPNILNAVERTTTDVDITVSPYWPIIKEMAAPDNYRKLFELTANKTGTVGGFEGWVLMEIYDELLSKIKS